MLTYDNNKVDIQGPINQGALYTCSSSLLIFFLFADDTNIFCSGNDPVELSKDR